MSGRRAKAERRRSRLGPFEVIERAPGFAVGEGDAVSYGSDRKQKREVLGRCYLCTEERVLLLSHVKPRWASKWMKAEGAVLHRPWDEDASNRMQDDYKHYMLCSECEQHLGEGENALARMSSASFDALDCNGLGTRRDPNGRWRIVGRNRALIQRALLGIALKYHFAPTAQFRIPGGPTLSEVRRAILTDDYRHISGPSAAKWFSFVGSGYPNPRAMVLLQYGDSPGVNGCRFMIMLGGITWEVPLDARAHQGELAEYEWSVLLGNLRINMMIYDDWEEQPDSFWDDWESWDKSLPCPCGSGTVTTACCAATWASA